MTSTRRRSLSNHAPPRPLSTISITSTSSSSSAPPGLLKSPSMSPTLPPSPIASASSYARSDESADSPHPLRVFDPFLNGNGPQSPALSTSTTAATFIANAANSLLKVARRAHACEPCRKSKTGCGECDEEGRCATCVAKNRKCVFSERDSQDRAAEYRLRAQSNEYVRKVMGEKIYKAYLEGQDPDELLRALGRPEGRISGGGVLGVIEDFCRLSHEVPSESSYIPTTATNNLSIHLSPTPDIDPIAIWNWKDGTIPIPPPPADLPTRGPVNLPQREECQLLIDIFFAKIHPLMPCFIPAQFKSWFDLLWDDDHPRERSGTRGWFPTTHQHDHQLGEGAPNAPGRTSTANQLIQFLPVLFAVLACAEATRITSDGQARRDGQAYYAEAMFHIHFVELHQEKTDGLPQLWKLQTLALLASHLAGLNALAGAWHLTGLAVEAVLLRKLHQHGNAGHGVDAEVRIRTFWCIFNLDRHLARILAQPFNLTISRNNRVALPLPYDTDSSHWASFWHEAAGAWSSDAPTPPTATITSGFILICHLNLIAGEVGSAFYMGPRDLSEDWKLTRERAELERQVSEFEAELEEKVAASEMETFVGSTEIEREQSGLLRLVLSDVIADVKLLIRRVLLPRGGPKPLNPGRLDGSFSLNPSLAIARKVIESNSLLRHAIPPSLYLAGAVVTLFHATVPVLHARLHGGAGDTDATYNQYIYQAVSGLSVLDSVWEGAARYADVLADLNSMSTLWRYKKKSRGSIDHFATISHDSASPSTSTMTMTPASKKTSRRLSKGAVASPPVKLEKPPGSLTTPLAAMTVVSPVPTTRHLEFNTPSSLGESSGGPPHPRPGRHHPYHSPPLTSAQRARSPPPQQRGRPVSFNSYHGTGGLSHKQQQADRPRLRARTSAGDHPPPIPLAPSSFPGGTIEPSWLNSTHLQHHQRHKMPRPRQQHHYSSSADATSTLRSLQQQQKQQDSSRMEDAPDGSPFSPVRPTTAAPRAIGGIGVGSGRLLSFTSASAAAAAAQEESNATTYEWGSSSSHDPRRALAAESDMYDAGVGVPSYYDQPPFGSASSSLPTHLDRARGAGSYISQHYEGDGGHSQQRQQSSTLSSSFSGSTPPPQAVFYNFQYQQQQSQQHQQDSQQQQQQQQRYHPHPHHRQSHSANSASNFAFAPSQDLTAYHLPHQQQQQMSSSTSPVYLRGSADQSVDFLSSPINTTNGELPPHTNGGGVDSHSTNSNFSYGGGPRSRSGSQHIGARHGQYEPHPYNKYPSHGLQHSGTFAPRGDLIVDVEDEDDANDPSAIMDLGSDGEARWEEDEHQLRLRRQPSPVSMRR